MKRLPDDDHGEALPSRRPLLVPFSRRTHATPDACGGRASGLRGAQLRALLRGAQQGSPQAGECTRELYVGRGGLAWKAVRLDGNRAGCRRWILMGQLPDARGEDCWRRQALYQ